MEKFIRSKWEQVSAVLEELGLSIPVESLLNLDLQNKSLEDKNYYAARAAILCSLERILESHTWKISIPEVWRFLVSGSKQLVVSEIGLRMWQEKARPFLGEV